ncbi:hypothetical protein [Escherichia coli]|uniref:hypothetical protein n=1 Tax=Escherichia coli TaxID=562 RepID=UPI004042BD50
MSSASTATSQPDGFGGTEPRITCNAYPTTQRKAWDVLSDFCSAMRRMPHVTADADVHSRTDHQIRWTYNRSNGDADDGAPFQLSALKDRHNAALR